MSDAEQDRRRTTLSKSMSYVLRHRAVDFNVPMDDEGFVLVSDLLATHKLQRMHATVDEVKHAVSVCQKQRFTLKTNEDGVLCIRANQGHSGKQVHVLNDETMLTRIQSAAEVPICVHGTYNQAWQQHIRHEGLRRMKRKHVHFASCDYGADEMISGMRSDVDILIHLDVAAALRDGMAIYRSANDVILTAGFTSRGVIAPKYFKRVERLVGGHRQRQQRQRVVIGGNEHEAAAEEKQQESPNHQYLLVLDFEATCDNPARLQPQEVIEFPCILLNTSTGVVEAEFHEYVRPVVHPRLTAFCTELTGIEQHTVDAADTWTNVFKRFTQFLRTHKLIDDHNQKSANVSWQFATCGDWDLKTMLPAQCAVSDNMKIPAYMGEWVNVKRAFRDTVKGKRGKKAASGMVTLLEHYGLPLQGRHHSGIDDTRNIARVCVAMMKDGIRL